MKTQSIFRKGYLLSFVFLFALLTPVLLNAQNSESRKQRKEREKKEQLQKYQAARTLILDSTFAMPADNVRFRDGSTMTPVQSSINFLKMEGDQAVVQIGSDFARTRGLNSLGGVTLKGQVSNLKITEEKSKHRLFMTFTLTGLIGTAQVSLALNGSDLANVNVNGMFSGRAVTMSGKIRPLQDASIFEGTQF